MKENKIAVISCVSDEESYKESLLYLQNLTVPDGFDIEVITVRMADSMANGYQEGMQSSDARYKVYLQQDVCLLHQNFFLDLIQCFRKNRQVGAIGLIGAVGLSRQLNWQQCDHTYGRLCFLNQKGQIIRKVFEKVEGSCQEVDAIGGAVFATQYDLKWREDLFDGWSLFDLAQSYEFRKKGYEVAVLRQEEDYYVQTLPHNGWRDDIAAYRELFCRKYMNIALCERKKFFTSIIVLTYNQLDYTKLCIESVRRHTQESSYELIVVDNHSSDGTIDWLKMQPDIRAIYNLKNEGFPKGCNQGIAIAQGTEILLLNNDTIVTEHWLEDLREALYSDPKIGAVGPVSNNVSNCQSIPVEYRNLVGIAGFSAKNREKNRYKIEEKQRLIGFCFLIKSDVAKKVGVLEESFSPGNCEDDDYSLRILEAGYRLFLCKGVFIHHFGGASFQRDNAFENLLKRNHKVFKKKWGFAVNDITDYHPQLCDVNGCFKENPDILCLGTAGGATVLAWKARFPKGCFYAVEPDNKLAKFAGYFSKVFQGDIMDFIAGISGKQFDLIVMDSYLQKLYDPWTALRNIKQLLKKEGTLVISLPNVLGCAVLERLFSGRWAYSDENGVMSKKNIRFFTVEESRQMLLEAGYEIIQIRCIVRDKTLQEQKLADKLAEAGLLSNLRDLDFDTFMIEAKLGTCDE